MVGDVAGVVEGGGMLSRPHELAAGEVQAAMLVRRLPAQLVVFRLDEGEDVGEQ